ncbi:MAG: type II toxin-antitoxin system HigB family toxin [Chitinophagales bacterium]
MRLIGKKKLERLRRKNKGNKKLSKAIDLLIDDIETNKWKSPSELKETRTDADCVHSEGFYFFNIAIHRTMILIEFEDDEASVVWAGNHKEYELIFKNNKNTIKSWLKSRNWIE